MDILNTILQAVLVGLPHALFAAGLSLFFGVIRLVNIAHCDLIVLAAYVAIVVVKATALHPLLSLIIAVPLMAAFGCLTLVYLLLRSRIGLALSAIRDSEVASLRLGIPITRVKFALYITVSAMTAMIGALISLQKLRISPDAAFSVNDGTAFVLFIGGIGTIEGPIVGTVVYFPLRSFMADYGSIYLLFLSALAIVVLLAVPKGLWGYVAAQAIAAAEAGAAILHLHARRPHDGGVSINPDHFAAFLPRIKQASDAVVNISTGGSLKNTMKDRIAPALRFCMDARLFKAPIFIQFIFGILGGIGPEVDNLIFMKRTADRRFGDDYRWSVLGAGGAQMGLATTASQIGGNVRVGLEDSLHVASGRLATSNAEQVRKIRRIIEDLGCEVAAPDEAHEILGLKGGDQVAF